VLNLAAKDLPTTTRPPRASKFALLLLLSWHLASTSMLWTGRLRQVQAANIVAEVPESAHLSSKDRSSAR